MVWGPTTVTPTNMAYGFKTLEMYHFESLPPLNMWPGSSAYDSKALGKGQASRTQKKEVIKEKVHTLVHLHLHAERSINTCMFAGKKYLAFVS